MTMFVQSVRAIQTEPIWDQSLVYGRFWQIYGGKDNDGPEQQQTKRVVPDLTAIIQNS